MATLAHGAVGRSASDDRFFLHAAIVMAIIIVAGFSTQLAMGRSSFSAPPLVHVHAVVFMGWVALYLLQNVYVATGNMALHRRLGWIGAGWVVAMIIMGITVTVLMVRRGGAPFFFPPAQFLILNPVTVLTFAGLTTAAIVMRRKTAWHRRLHFCGMALLLGPAFGRLLPMPLLAPWAFEILSVPILLFPIAGMIADRRRTGHVHPAWRWGIGVMAASIVFTDVLAFSPAGNAIYRAVVAGSPAQSIAPYAYPAPPGAP